MVTDSLTNAKQYYGLGERIAKALRYLQEHDGTLLPLGKTPIDGEQIFHWFRTTRPSQKPKECGRRIANT